MLWIHDWTLSPTCEIKSMQTLFQPIKHFLLLASFCLLIESINLFVYPKIMLTNYILGILLLWGFYESKQITIELAQPLFAPLFPLILHHVVTTPRTWLFSFQVKKWSCSRFYRFTNYMTNETEQQLINKHIRTTPNSVESLSTTTKRRFNQVHGKLML
jgi:hypothetical protein